MPRLPGPYREAGGRNSSTMGASTGGTYDTATGAPSWPAAAAAAGVATNNEIATSATTTSNTNRDTRPSGVQPINRGKRQRPGYASGATQRHGSPFWDR